MGGRADPDDAPDGFGALRPMSVPIILGTGGPKGEAVAHDLGLAYKPVAEVLK